MHPGKTLSSLHTVHTVLWKPWRASDPTHQFEAEVRAILFFFLRSVLQIADVTSFGIGLCFLESERNKGWFEEEDYGESLAPKARADIFRRMRSEECSEVEKRALKCDFLLNVFYV